jgi:hypothetical protein
MRRTDGVWFLAWWPAVRAYALPAAGSPFNCDHSKWMRDGRLVRPSAGVWEMGAEATVAG